MMNIAVLFGAFSCILAASEGVSIQVKRLQNRIILGHRISIREAGYHLSLELNGKFQCSAAIISEQWALTAARCFDKERNPARYQLVSNSSLPYSFAKNAIVHDVISIKIHDQHVYKSLDYDIAALRVANSFRAPNSVAVNVELPRTNMNLFQTMALVTGWGVQDPFLGDKAEYLQRLEVPIVDTATCKRMHSFSITERIICAGDRRGGSGICTGDEGDPLVITLPQGNKVLLGLALTWRRYCMGPVSPGLFVDIWSVRDWIFRETGV